MGLIVFEEKPHCARAPGVTIKSKGERAHPRHQPATDRFHRIFLFGLGIVALNGSDFARTLEG